MTQMGACEKPGHDLTMMDSCHEHQSNCQDTEQFCGEDCCSAAYFFLPVEYPFSAPSGHRFDSMILLYFPDPATSLQYRPPLILS